MMSIWSNMRNQHRIISTILFFVISSSAVEWPSNIKRCTTNATDLSKCLMEAAKDAVPKLIKGHPGLGFVSLDPLKFTNMSTSSDRPGVKLSFEVPHGTIEGINDMTIKKISYDKDKHVFIVDAAFKRIKMSGNYNVRGKLLFLNLRSHGYFEMITENLDAHHKVKLTPSRKKGFYSMDLDYKIRKLDHMSMNLNDAILPYAAESALNDVVNENWRRISDAFLPTMEKATQTIFRQVMSPLFKKFPLTTIFPDKL